jgi:dTDP-4-amino-4,6-dideoxygalactose transaminase
MSALSALADEAGVPVVEDAAQAIGAAIDGHQAGTLGTAGCFSFYPTKNLGGFGDGGLVTTNDDDLADRVRSLRDHGASAPYQHNLVGGNFRLDALQAAVLRVKLPRLTDWTAGRRANATRYGELFQRLSATAVTSLPVEPDGRTHVYHQYVIRTRARDSLRVHLASKGVTTGLYYSVPLHWQPCFANIAGARATFPHAELASVETLALPIYPELTLAQQKFVAETISEYVP